MSFCWKTILVVQRRLGQQTLWRHPFFMVAELCFVLISFGFVLMHDHVDPEKVMKLETYGFLPDARNLYSNNFYYGCPTTYVVYGPSNNYTKRIVEEILDRRNSRNGIRPQCFIDFKAVATADAVIQASLKRIRRNKTIFGEYEVLGIQFWGQGSSNRLPRHQTQSLHRTATLVDTHSPSGTQTTFGNLSLSYTLVYYFPREMIPSKEAQLDVAAYLRKYNANSTTLKEDFGHLDVVERIIRAQDRIDKARIRMEVASTHTTDYSIDYKPMPMTPPFRDVEAYRNGFFFALSIAFYLTLIFRIGDVTKEISSGLMEHQRLMGLSMGQFWLGHFVSALAVGLVEGCLVIGVIYWSTKDFAAPGATARARNGRRTPDYERVNNDFLSIPYLNNCDVTVVAVAFFAFHVCHTLLALLVACILPSGPWAALAGFGLFVILPCYDRTNFNFNIFSPKPLSSYLGEDRITKLRRCLYSNAALDTVMKIIGIFSDFELNVGWHVVDKMALGCDNVTIVEVWSVMAASALAASVLLWYLSHVLPWTTSNPQNPLFPLLPSYWCPRPLKLGKRQDASSSENERFETLPEESVVIECRGLKKYYGNFAALDSLDLTIHRGQVTVLLGHTGAGKTTLFNILIGVCKPSGGSATVSGFDVSSAASEGMVGYCPQNDVFFDDLTVVEHLEYYAALKGVTDTSTHVRLKTKLHKLRDKGLNFPHQLSGGYKRKLSVAIALITSPKLIILDEPTLGMDPEMRRSFWHLINKLRGKSTILVTTHHMEEADAIADRIIVMHSGKIICSGSPTFLKEACGVGYKLHVGKAETGLKSNEVLALIRQTVSLAVIERELDDEISIALHTFDSTGFEAMFRQLEQGATWMGIKSLSVSAATMNDAYIKMHREWVPREKSSRQQNDTGANTMPQTQVQASTMPLLATSMASVGATTRATTMETAGTAVSDVLGTTKVHRRKARRSGQAPGLCVQFRALLGKRYAYLSNSKTLFIFGWLLPVLIALLPLIVGELQETEDVGPAVTRIPLGAAAFYGPGVRAFLHHVTGNSTNLSRNFEVLLENSNISIDQTKDLDKELLEVLKESYFEYGSKSAVVGVFNDTGIQVWHNPINLFGLPIVKNLVHTALLRTYSGNALSSITTDVALYPLPEEDRPQEERKDTPTDQERKQRLQELRELVLENWLYWGCIVTISFGLILSSFVVFPAAEAHNGARGLQLMTGVSGCVYLKADFFFDFLFYLIPMATIYGTFAILQKLSSLTTGALGVIVVSFAPLGILLPYFITDRIESDSSAHSVMMGVFAIGGPAAFILFMFIAFTTGSAGLRIPLLFFPPFLLAATTIRAINLEFEEEMCEILSHSSLDTQFCEKMSTFGSGIIQCCKALSEPKASTESPQKKRFDVTTPYSPTWYGILPELVMMLALALPLYCCVLRTRRSAYGTGFKLRDLHTPHLDDDVDDEKELVNRLVRKKKFRRHAMLVRNLHKFFDDFYAVRGVYLALRPSECFGLVGVNGAGKTTTFQMLTALLEMTDGNAYMKSLILSEQPREWQSFIGYCPQRDALLSRLNAYETLRLFGRLRGVPGQELDQMAKRLIKVVDLEEHATKLCEHYSGGQKRKLCIAVALMGFPRVVFLDEPYAGVDVISRNNMREAITALKESTKTAIVLTSHNMAECEVSCDRFAIMVKGQMTCIGTMQQLKSKFGKGSSIQFVAPVGSKINTKDLNQAVVTSFPGAEQNPEDGLKFVLSQRPAWSTLFRRVSALQRTFAFDHVIVKDMDLEELFLAFARKAQEDAKNEIKL